MSSAIENIGIRKILDSRGNATVEIDVTTETGFGRAAAPSGASTGALEAVAFPEDGIDSILNTFQERVKTELVGINAEETFLIDDILKEIDGTDNLSSLGGNVTVAISLATAKAAASSYDMPLYMFLGGNLKNEIPYPLGNMINGGAHAGKNAPDIQEFLVVPVGAKNITEAVFANSSVHKKIGELIKVKDAQFTGGKGDEGGWAPNLSNYEALEIQSKACEEISDETGIKVRPSLDLAPSELWDGSKYVYGREGVNRDTGEQIDFVEEIIDTYKMFFVEDPLREEDFEGFSQLTKKVGNKCIICGDDIFVTNSELLSKGIERGAANAIIIKPNQIGTLSDTYKTVKLAKDNNYTPVVSHRSGETTDETIAHLAVAFGAPLIKTGAIGGERIAKLNELIRIQEEMPNSVMANLK
ncbi:phosphopyruvate hydratase [Methanobacterium formicicum]|uniref:phosphopyruvate hydratase n=1 Tax=Methanobacterium formicicum TaxID=2162 RepID=UPI002412E145|nr:phosphopyruvate hydratase [Methanobacterium formicicum]MDG3547308.1 phosphopyruvate hydratase [Methanobacterium formicicum]